VLFAIDAMDSPRLSEVADAVHSDLSTVSRQVTAMVSHGLLAKEADATDGRAQVLRVTDAGHAAIATIKAARGEWLENLLADWEPDDATTFTRHLSHLGDNLDAQLRARGHTPTLPPYFSKEK
jgi:DNA-binding MarR family transcriptional regulator